MEIRKLESRKYVKKLNVNYIFYRQKENCLPLNFIKNQGFRNLNVMSLW